MHRPLVRFPKYERFKHKSEWEWGKENLAKIKGIKAAWESSK